MLGCVRRTRADLPLAESGEVKAPSVRCVRCDARIKYATLDGSRRGSALDAVPHPTGAVRLIEDGDARPTGQSLAGEALALATGKLFRLHECPKNARGLL